jgi:hypothetical protein
MNRVRRTTAMFTVLLALAGQAGAQALDEAIRVGGFVSQGYLNTRGSEYLVPRSREGTAEMFEAAITMTAQPVDRLRVGVQFLARNFGDSGNGSAVVDWAYLDYRWDDRLGLRGGKVKLPFGLYNEQRDLDILRTGVFLPQSVYSEYLRDFALAYEGLGAYGSLVSGAGDVDYHLFAGTLNVPDAGAGYWKNIFERNAESSEDAIADLVEQERNLAPGSATATFAGVVDPVITFPWIWGGALVWEPPLDGLRLGGSFLTGRFLYEADARYDVDIAPAMPGDPIGYTSFTLPVRDDQDMDHLLVFSAEYTWRDIMLATEYYDERIGHDTPAGWYVLADWRARPGVSLAATWSEYWGNKHDRGGDFYEGLGLPAYYGWQQDLTGAVRFDLNDHWLVKFEYHLIDGVNQTRTGSVADAAADPAPRHWGMFAARTTVHF